MTTSHQSHTPAAEEHFDLIIIGTGSGNSIPSPDFDDQKIAIIEKGTFGGTCLNVGCIPTKMYVYAADIALAAREAGRLGLDAQVNSVDWDSIVDRVFTNRIDQIAQGGEQYRRGEETPNITVFDEHARFVGPKTIQTGEHVISGDQIVIAAGSRPVIPEVYANSGVKYYTNEDIMRMDHQPESLIVVGGGYIAMEFAHVFDGLGTKVTVVNRSETLLRHLDDDLSSRFNQIARDRFDVRIANGTKLEETDTGVRLELDNGESVEAEAILVATGRTPNGDQMDLDKAGIELLADARSGSLDPTRFQQELADRLESAQPYSLRRVINATGVIIHTNLGRAPLPPAAVDALAAAAGYTDVEMDLDSGLRSRDRGRGAVEAVLAACPGAEDALVVNNGASALLLATAALAPGKELIISRGELIEIGAGFRLPELIESTATRLREVCLLYTSPSPRD